MCEQQAPPVSGVGHRLVLAAGVLTTGALALALARVPVGVPSEWVTEYGSSPHFGRAWACALALAAVVGCCWLALRRRQWTRRPRVAFALALVVLSFVAHVVVACSGEFGFGEFIPAILWDRAMGPYYKEAEGLPSAQHYMVSLPARVRGGYQHSNTHPAGPGLLFYGGIQLLRDRPGLADAVSRTARRVAPMGENVFLVDEPLAARRAKASALLIGLALCLAAALAPAVTYALGLKLAGHRAGVLAAGLTAMLPSAMLFSPGVDQLMPVLSVAVCAAAYACAVRSCKPRWPAGAADLGLWLAGALLGVALYAAFFFSLAFLVNIALCGLCVVAASRAFGRGWRDVARMAAVVGLAACAVFVALSAAMWCLFGYNTWAVLWAIYRQNDAFNVHASRTYWKWLLANPVQFALFSGASVVTLLAWGVLSDLRRVLHRRRAAVPYALCFVAVMALLWVTGKNLGEVDRLWVFVMPLAALAGCASLRVGDRLSANGAAALLGWQALHVVVYRVCFDVYGTAGYLQKLLE